MDNELKELPETNIEIEQLPVSLIEPIWEQQAHLGETHEYYTMFLAYSALHPAQRTLQRSWEAWSGKTTPYSSTYMSLNLKFKWRERAAAFDVYRLKNAHQDWIMRDNERRTADFEIAELFRNLARQALSDLNPGELSNNSIARFAELASKLQQDAVPEIALQKEELRDLMDALPDDRKKEVIGILVARYRK